MRWYIIVIHCIGCVVHARETLICYTEVKILKIFIKLTVDTKLHYINYTATSYDNQMMLASFSYHTLTKKLYLWVQQILCTYMYFKIPLPMYPIQCLVTVLHSYTLRSTWIYTPIQTYTLMHTLFYALDHQINVIFISRKDGCCGKTSIYER